MLPARVLVVDDDVAVLGFMRSAFSALGAAVDAADGPDALQLLDERCYDLVISDARMPVADGLTILGKARLACPAGTRVLASGCPSDLERGRFDGSPADLLLPKPVSLHTLGEILDAARAERAAFEALLAGVRSRHAGAHDAVFVKDTRGRYLVMNATGALLLGRAEGDVVGRLDSEIFDAPTLLEEVRASDQAVMRTRERFLYANATRTTGSARLFLSAKFPVFGARGAVIAIACLSREATSRSEALLEELVRDLREFALLVSVDVAPIERDEIERCLADAAGDEVVSPRA